MRTRTSARHARLAVFASLVLIGVVAAPAVAEFPHKSDTGDSSDPYAYEKYMYIDDAEADFPPPDLGDDDWKYSSKNACELYGEEHMNCDPLVVANPQELNGVTGASVDLAWETSTGRPDVVIAVHDSGVEWDDGDVIDDLTTKTWLNRGELPEPDWGTRDPAHPYDRNADGVFNIVDYCPNWREKNDCGGTGDSRLRGAAGTADTDYNANGVIDPEDVIFEFSNGVDEDDNGYTDDFVGWDTFEGDNDPYDEPHYGHGSGEARDSTGEWGGDGSTGTCPNCLVMHMRVGDSFIADVNDFAEGVLYSTDNGASIVQSALGTLNNSRFAQEAINYAYRRGTVLIASAADEAAGHHNQPSVLEHGVTFNSIGQPLVPGTSPRTYLEFRGCTNWGAYIAASVPSDSCSSEAVGRMAGMAGLMYSTARNEIAKGTGVLDYGILDGNGGIPAGRGLSAEEIDQLVATSSDDINFRTPVPYTARTIPGSERYPGTEGWDPFFGYGRVNAERMVRAVKENKIPPEADITRPRWFEIVDPDEETIEIRGTVASRRSDAYTYEVQWGVWSWRENGTEAAPEYLTDGVTLQFPGQQSVEHTGVLATIDMATVEAELDAINAPNPGTSGPAVDPVTGRGDNENRHLPDKFGVIARIVATARNTDGTALTNIDGDPLTGIGTKNFHVHDDPALFPGFPRNLNGDGAAGPRFADLNDDGKDELIVATSNGSVHAYKDGGGELPGWPVRTTPIDVNSESPAYQSGEITLPLHAAVLRSPAVGDIDRDGRLEVVFGDFRGRITAVDSHGDVLPGFPVRSNPVFSAPQSDDRANGFYDDHPELVPGKYPGPGALPNDPDLVPDLVNRRDKMNRTINWFLAAPSLGNIDPTDDDLEIVAGAGDRHIYAWHSDGTAVPGWPVMLRDPAKVDAVNAVTHEITHNEAAERFDGAKIVTSPAIGDIDGDGVNEVISAVNEQYREDPNTDDPSTNAFNEPPLNDVSEPGNNRVYAIFNDGSLHGTGPGTPANGHPNANAFLPNWPVPIATFRLQLLPVVGSGPDGAPILANIDGGTDLETGIFGTAGPGYILGPDGNSIYGKTADKDNTLLTNAPGPDNNSPQDSTSIPAVGGAIFSDFTGDGISFVAPAAGIGKLLDVALPEDQVVSDNHLSAWKTTEDRSQQPAFPREVNDLQFLATPASADIDGDDSDEILEGSAYSDLHAFSNLGREPGMDTLDPDGWPKFTGGWSVAPPTVGDFDGDGTRDIAHTIREGRLFVWHGNGAGVCDSASWPEFGHDGWNTNNFTIDAVRPAPIDFLAVTNGDQISLSWNAPGEDGPCGTAHSYDVRRSGEPITPGNFESATPVDGEPTPAAAGVNQTMVLERGQCDTWIAMRSFDADPQTDTPVQPANPSAISNVIRVKGTNPSFCSPTELELIGQKSGQPTDNAIIGARLTGPDGPVGGRAVVIRFQGRTRVVETGANGNALFGIRIKGPAGDYPIKATFGGTANFGPSEIEGTFEVVREDTRTRLLETDDNRVMRARVVDDDSGDRLSTGRVRFFVNGRFVGGATPDDRGVARVERDRKLKNGQLIRAVYRKNDTFRRSTDERTHPI